MTLKLFVISFFISLTTLSAQDDMHISEKLLNCTIRIEAVKRDVLNNVDSVSTGTGFFFQFTVDSAKKIYAPVIITNKHVIKGYEKVRLFFRKAKNNMPVYGQPYIISIPNDSRYVVQHPDEKIDLVAIPIVPIIDQSKKFFSDIYYTSFDENFILNDSILKVKFRSIEDVYMIGYPNGLWDERNNMPIVRKGITATSPHIDYNTRREFLVDIAMFKGSSGSPVILYSDRATSAKDNPFSITVGTYVYLLGIIYREPLYSVEGKAISITDSIYNANIKAQIPMNIGYVIKASEILEFKKLVIN